MGGVWTAMDREVPVTKTRTVGLLALFGVFVDACDADLNGSGTVTSADFAILRALLNTAPGPSGLNP